jgi:hypothetical protein
VRAYDSATVTASGSATVRAYDSATVRAYGSATVTASGSATVRAYDSATVRAYGSATVTAHGSATVTAHGSVSVHIFTSYGQTPKVSGGIILKVPDLETCDAPTWLTYHGIDVTRAGYAVLFKAVDNDWHASHGATWTYEPGNTVTAEDYAPTRECGAGLHLGATPHHATAYMAEATRWVAVKVKVSELIPLGDKAKTRSVKVLWEVDYDGKKVSS